MDHFAYCENLVREADRDRFLATLYAPEKTRRQLFALYAFAVEIARVADRVSEPMAGEIRLQWWRDALAGTRASEARAHPPAAALFDTVVRARLPVPALLEMIEARSFDLYRDPIPSLAALEGYAVKTSSALVELAAAILGGAPSNAVSAAARSAGLAYGLATALAGPRRKLFLPLDVLERHHGDSEDVRAGRMTTEVTNALGELRQRAQAHFNDYQEQSRTLPAQLAPAFLPTALVPLYLKRLVRTPLSARAEVPVWRRQWTLSRAARQA
jgi:phytoene synthase